MAFDFAGAQGLMNPQSDVDPLAALHMLVTDPEAIIPHLAAAGIPPPAPGALNQFASLGGGTPQVSDDGRISTTPYTPNPISTIAGSGIAGPGESSPGVVAQPPSAPGIPPSLGGMVNPLVGGNGTGMTGFTPSAFGPPLPFGASEAPTPAPVASSQAPGAPLDIRPDAQRKEAPKVADEAGSKKSIDNAIRALQGVRLPTQPSYQKLDSPRVTAGHAISQTPPAVAALMEKLIGNSSSGGLRLGQAVR